MSDRLLSYVTESLENLHHYVNYRGRSYEDLAILQKAVHELNQAIDIRLIRDFKDHPEMAELFKLLEAKKK
jgi:hypothetical protein